jgi:hypothetical protein
VVSARARRRLVTALGALLVAAAAASVASAPASVGAAAVSVGAATAGGVGAAAAGVSVRVGAAPSAIRPINAGFVGLGLEYKSIPQLVGPASSVNPVLVQLIRNMAPGGRPVIRIGGLSTDRTWWPVPGVARPIGMTYALTPEWMARTRALVDALDGRLILGLGLQADDPRIDAVEARTMLAALGQRHIAALEIGNEPELYRTIAWYRLLAGHPVPWYLAEGTPIFSRGPGYGPQQYLAEFARAMSGLPRVPIAGPGTGNLGWLGVFAGRFLAPGSRERMLTWHAYGASQCDHDPASPGYPSVAHLLSVADSRAIVAGIGPLIGLAHRDGGHFRIDEMGPVSCNGHPGVSNVFASALWVMDALFQAAADAVDGVNIHTFPNGLNSLFDFTDAAGRWSAVVHPLYYGVLMFERAAPAGSRLLPTASSDPDVRAWATVGRAGHVRVLLINDRVDAPADVAVTVDGRHGVAGVQRLTAPGVGAHAGVTLGGQTYGPATTTGVLSPSVPVTLAPQGGSYALTLPPASAALLTIPAT